MADDKNHTSVCIGYVFFNKNPSASKWRFSVLHQIEFVIYPYKNSVIILQ